MDRKDFLASGQTIINRLSELYPQTFVRERFMPHRAIALGIGNQLITAGGLTRDETRALAMYTRRLVYLRAMVAGAPRIGLGDEPAGEVSAEHAKCAKASLDAQLKRRDEKAAKAKAQRTAAAAAKRAARNGAGPVRATASGVARNGAAPKCAAEVKPTPVEQPNAPRRLGLAGLKPAALARKAARDGRTSTNR
jgi:sRNA-binding protein